MLTQMFLPKLCKYNCLSNYFIFSQDQDAPFFTLSRCLRCIQLNKNGPKSTHTPSLLVGIRPTKVLFKIDGMHIRFSYIDRKALNPKIIIFVNNFFLFQESSHLEVVKCFWITGQKLDSIAPCFEKPNQDKVYFQRQCLSALYK